MPHFPLARRVFVTTVALACSLRTSPSSADSDWDALPEIRPTNSVAASNLLHGQHYSLGPTVTTFAYMNRYSVASDYGPFVAQRGRPRPRGGGCHRGRRILSSVRISDSMLRRLIREIAAIAQLKAIQQTDALEKAAVEAGKSSLRSAKKLIDDPAGTLSAIPEGIGSIFDRASEQLRRSGHSQYEDDSAKQMLAVSSFKRDFAAKLGVDVYSSNEVLQKELNRLAWASVAGSMALGALSMATGAVVLKAASDVRVLEQARNLVEAEPPSELSR
jgi:hypothetical protein